MAAMLLSLQQVEKAMPVFHATDCLREGRVRECMFSSARPSAAME